MHEYIWTGMRRGLAFFGMALLLVIPASLLLGHLRNEFMLDCHFTVQAMGFLEGRLDAPISFLKESHTTLDYTLVDGRYYWPLKPMPSLLLIPIVMTFGPLHAQATLRLLAFAVIVTFGYLLARRRGFDVNAAFWLTLVLAIGSVLMGPLMLHGSWYLANVITVAFGIVALWEQAGRNRLWLLGLLTAAAWATRQTAGAALAAYFGLCLLWESRHLPWRMILVRCLAFGLPIALTLAGLLAFDWVRFGNPLESGYSQSILGPSPELDRRTATGLFDWSYLPMNFHWYFMALPNPEEGKLLADPHGVSLFIVSPICFWLASRRRMTVRDWFAAISALVVTVVLLSYYATGYYTYGPRYLCDVLPLLHLLLLGVFTQVPFGRLAKAVTVIGIIVNLFLFTTMYGIII